MAEKKKDLSVFFLLKSFLPEIFSLNIFQRHSKITKVYKFKVIKQPTIFRLFKRA